MRGYFTITRITDFGPYVTKIILPVPETVASDRVCADQFSVYVERMDPEGKLHYMPRSFLEPDKVYPSKGFTPVLRAYASDRTGKEQDAGAFITLDMAYGPSFPYSAALGHSGDGHEFFLNNCYRITQVADIIAQNGTGLSGLVFSRKLRDFMPDVHGFIDTVSS